MLKTNSADAEDDFFQNFLSVIRLNSEGTHQLFLFFQEGAIFFNNTSTGSNNK